MDPEVLMNMESMHRRLPGAALLLLPLVAFALLWSGSLPAQVPVDEDGNPLEALDEATEPGAVTTPLEGEEAPPLTQEELETLVGPIALYPDKLLAIVLPASTYPLEIVQAARFLEQLEEDSSLKPDESWDDSVTALLNYPEVVKMMNDDIDWTWRLGEAVVRQQAEVVAAVEAFRDRAYAAGNLKSDERQTVSNNGGAIEIEPIEEDVIYVPYYEPERVVYYRGRSTTTIPGPTRCITTRTLRTTHSWQVTSGASPRRSISAGRPTTCTFFTIATGAILTTDASTSGITIAARASPSTTRITPTATAIGRTTTIVSAITGSRGTAARDPGTIAHGSNVLATIRGQGLPKASGCRNATAPPARATAPASVVTQAIRREATMT
jgi:hypothetical protein